MKKIYIVVGTGNLAVKIAEYLISQKLDTVVYEKQLSQYSTVKEFCVAKKIDYTLLTSKEMTEQLLSDLENFEIKVISAINTYIFPKEIVEHVNFYGINYHNALLPQHKGMNAEAWSIFNLEKHTGITWHRIVEKVDQGEIILQKRIAINSSITSMKLLRIQLDMAYESFVEFAPQLIEETLIIEPQKSNDGEFHRIKDIPNNGYIDKTWSMVKLSAFLRAMDYGILYTMGKPIIKIDSKAYSCGRYRITENNIPAGKDEIIFEDNVITILKKNSYGKVMLSNITMIG